MLRFYVMHSMMNLVFWLRLIYQEKMNSATYKYFPKCIEYRFHCRDG